MTGRIASLLPGATEIVCALGSGDRLVAVSHACEPLGAVAPPARVTRSWLTASTSSGAIDRSVLTRARAGRAPHGLDADRLAEASPAPIITQRLCGVCAVSEGEVRAVARALPGSPPVLGLELLAHAIDPDAHPLPAGGTAAARVPAEDLRRMLAPASHQ